MIDRAGDGSLQKSIALTVFLSGVSNGIDLSDSEANELLNIMKCEATQSNLLEDPTVYGGGVSSSDIAWYTVLGPKCRYDQDALLRPRLGAIRQHNPKSRILIQPSESSASKIRQWRASTIDLDVDWLEPLPIHTSGSGITMTGAMLDAYLQMPHRPGYLIKVDLDARVHRPFHRIPKNSSGVFGTLEHFTHSGTSFGDFPNVQGGCYGMSRETAQQIRDAAILERTDFKENPGIWVDGVSEWRNLPELKITLEDGLLRWVTKQLNLKPHPFEEIDSRFRRILGYEGDFAVTHPHKRLEPDELKNGASAPARVDPPGLDDIFDRNWFSHWEKFRPDYHRLADWLLSIIPTSEVLDLGCGAGYMLERFAGRGLRVRGIDGSRHARNAAPPGLSEAIAVRDLRLPFDFGQFELVVCCDLAAHLPPSSADEVVKSIVSHVGGYLFFSSAVPGQGGRYHLNEQPVDYWIKKFESYGLAYEPGLTAKFRLESAPSALQWISKTALIFRDVSRERSSLVT